MDKSFSATPAACLPTPRLILDRLLPAVLFGTMTFSSLSKLARLWLTPVDPGFETSLLHMLALGHELLTLAFLALLTVLFVVRRTPLSARADPVAMVIAVGGTFVMWIALAQPATTEDWRVLAGADLVMISGLAFTLYALGTLRACFGLAPEARGLVTTGAYRLVRHPVYLGEFVIFLGALVPVLAPLTALIFALFCLLQARRAALEEAVLTATFPDYATYRQRTPALLPWARP